MQNDYVEAKPGFLSSINIVPLVGVFMALLVVIMLGFPSTTQRHLNSASWGCCLGCPHDDPHTHKLKIRIDSNGNTSLDNIALTTSEIVETIASAPENVSHQVIAEVDIDADASYQDAMSLISALHKSGLEEKDIRILDSRWR